MKFQFDIGSRHRSVDIERVASAAGPTPGAHANAYQVIVDGARISVEAVRIDETRWSLVLQDADGTRRSVEAVAMPQNGDGSLHVYIDGHLIEVGMRSRRARRSGDAGVGPSGGPQRLTAPMPGKVARVLVRPGDEVQPRQGLVVVEAMKMENELRASRAGRVRDVLVTQGQSVEAGTALVVVE